VSPPSAPPPPTPAWSNYRPVPPAWRATAVELRRGAPPLLAVAVAAAGIGFLFVHPADWSGRWLGLAGYLRTELILLAPLTAAVAAWQGGRERRRGLVELLASTARPGWQPMVWTWAALTSAAVAGYLLAAAVGAVLVAPVASYLGGGWWWLVLGGLPALAMAAAAGLAAGRLIPSRVTGLGLAVVMYAAIGVPTYSNREGIAWLSPMLDGNFNGERPTGPVLTLLQPGWFGCLVVVFLAAAATGHLGRSARPWTPLIAVSAAGALAALAASNLVSRPNGSAWAADPKARNLVCTTEPQVCLGRVDAFLLQDIGPELQTALRRLQGVHGAPVRAVAGYDPAPVPGNSILPLYSPIATVTGHLHPATDQISDYLMDVVSSRMVWDVACYERLTEAEQLNPDLSVGAELATAWTLDRLPADPIGTIQTVVEARTSPRWSRLRAMPQAEQQDWMGGYLAARQSCDAIALARLLNRLDQP
jgi:hypothetical protein